MTAEDAFLEKNFSLTESDEGCITVKYGDRVVGEFACLKELDSREISKNIGYDTRAMLKFNEKLNEFKIKGKTLAGYIEKLRMQDYFDTEGRFIPKRLADEILDHYGFATMRDTKEIYVYQDGVYRPVGETVILEATQRALGDKCRNIHKSEVVGYVQAATFTERSEFDNDLKLVNLRNGVFHLDSMILEPHNPDVKFIQQLPVEYDKDKDCPEIKRFLTQVLPIVNDREAIEELIGYCLYRGHPHQKAFMLVGEGANGKSTLIRVIKALLGTENVTSRSLHELEENRFSTAELYGKLANLYPDLSDRALQGTGKFKALTGGDPITGEHKFQRGFVFGNYSKQIFSCNRVPMVYDDTDAFFRRWIIINFPNKFEGVNDDKHLFEKLTTPDELSGLFNLAVEALKRLLSRGGFANEKETAKIREDYIRRSDSVQAFIIDMIEQSPQDKVEKKLLYQAYCEYCRSRNYPAVNDRTFFKRFMKHVQVEEGRGPRPEQARIFIGIRLAEPENDGNCDRCDAISNENPTLSSMGIEGNRVEKSLEHPSHPSQTILKKVCGTCYKKRNYEQLGIPAKGKVSEGACQDCGSHAELLIDISEPRSNRLADLNDNA